MTAVYVGRMNRINWVAEYSDLVAGELPLAQPGMIVYLTDLEETYIVNADFSLSLYVTPMAGADGFIGKVQTPNFTDSDSFKRPNNTTDYADTDAMGINLTVTDIGYTLKTVTLTFAELHWLSAGDRITIAGVNTGATVTAIDGNWIVASAPTTSSITFDVTMQPTGTTPQTGLTIANACAKMLSIALGGDMGSGWAITRLTLECPGIAMTGAIRAYMFSEQETALVDQATFSLLSGTSLLDYFDFTPVVEGASSDMTFAMVRPTAGNVYQSTDSANRLYFILVAKAASTPIVLAEIKLSISANRLS